MKKVVGIRFKPAGKIYNFDSGAFVLKQGDKVTVRSSTKWILDKTALELGWEADINGKPAGCGKALIGWDRSTKEIVTLGFGSFGGCGKSTFHKVGERWIEANVGAGLDGRKHAGQTVITFAEDGNTQVHEITGRVSPEGEPLPHFTITYKRAKANE